MGDFPNIFRKIREQSGLTQQQMADKLGVSRSAIGMYENGEREPNFETLELIADTFNVDMNYLYGRTDIKIADPVTPKHSASSAPIPDRYYLDDDARDMAQFMYENPEYKVLFDASRKVKKEDIDFVKQMIDRMSNKGDD